MRIVVASVLVALSMAPVAVATATDSPLATKRVVRAWSEMLNAYDNVGVAKLFARPTVIIQNGVGLELRRTADLVRWHRLLPCAGRIVSLTVKGEYATAVFVLRNGRNRRCDAPGVKAAAIFRVRNGKIVSWTQIPVPVGPVA